MSEAVIQRLKISREGVILIKSFEGFRPRAIRRDDGQWVIGYGHTLSAREGAVVSEADAELLLQYDLIPVAKAVNEGVAAVLNQHQFDALASFAFSVGVDRFQSSDVLSRLNAGFAGEAADAMIGWPEPVVAETALRRRAAERALFVANPGSPVALADLLAAPLPPPLVATPAPVEPPPPRSSPKRPSRPPPPRPRFRPNTSRPTSISPGIWPRARATPRSPPCWPIPPPSCDSRSPSRKLRSKPRPRSRRSNPRDQGPRRGARRRRGCGRGSARRRARSRDARGCRSRTRSARARPGRRLRRQPPDAALFGLFGSHRRPPARRDPLADRQRLPPGPGRTGSGG
ncbi:lysozyme [Brevundimonas goettingensis]|uniref:Lysozyme n=1 Tax=Brevundimonas goettingensis TaxID=2774190 RepID=A0A975BZA2_9CAUL|nr:lysozyme [Brevundimonas goettingensis]QTC89807.1 lysozyme [Brevundimonas goettingensis]